jgi:hypothetical protein
MGEAGISQATKACPNAILPAQTVTGKIDQINQVVRESLNEVFLAADMIVERHRAYAQVIRKAPHCHRVWSLAISERERFRENPLVIETFSVQPFSSHRELACHGTETSDFALYTTYIYYAHIPYGSV